RRNSTRKGFNAIIVRNGDIVQMNAKIKGEWFVNIDDKVKSKIKFANNSSVTAEGIRKLMIQRKDGQHSFINDVLYVPNMKNNLLSLGQLLEKG
ncbi:hypothetical protein glysoja_045527, partial [Glycine soja]